MNFRIGNQSFANVQIPLLWGQRAIIQDRKNRLSVIDLSEPIAKLEILGDEPAQGITFEPSFSGFKITKERNGLVPIRSNGEASRESIFGIARLRGNVLSDTNR